MTILSTLQKIGSFSFLFSLCTWFFSDVEKKYKIIITIACFLISAIWYFLFEFSIRYKNLKNENKALTEANEKLTKALKEKELSHEDLKAKYDKKLTLIKLYQNAWSDMRDIFNMPKTKSSKQKLSIMSDIFISYSLYLHNEELFNEHQNKKK